MTLVNGPSVLAALRLAGFSPCARSPGLFLVDKNIPVTPAFICLMIRKGGNVRFSGGVGLYFEEFENLWENSVFSHRKRFGFTLPIIMTIDNYMTLIDGGVFSFTSHYNKITDHARQIYSLCLEFPCSMEAFDQALITGKMIDKNVSDYLHISEFQDDGNVFFKKSVGFIHWLSGKFPGVSKHMHGCLTRYQLQKVESTSLKLQGLDT